VRLAPVVLLAACVAPNTVTLVGPAGDSRKDYYRDAELVRDERGTTVRLLGERGKNSALGGLPSDRAFVDIPVPEPFAPGTYPLARAVRAGSRGVDKHNYLEFPQGQVVVESYADSVLTGWFEASRGALRIGGNFKVAAK
jgi:hypothetical protein